MQHLTLVGLTEDKTKLVLVSDAGAEYTLAVDAKLLAALRGDHARLGQLEIRMDSALRPRDIQARIRAGETPESVAQAAQTTVDRVMTYAGPVLAERAHIADKAQRASVRRKAGEGPARILGDTVAERLRAKNVDPDSVEWDSWRREDGRWTLVADYRLDDRPKHAVFTFDVQGRYVVAEDDDSRWLVGEPTARRAQPRPGSTGGGRRLSAVQSEPELPLGDDAIEMVTTPEEAGPDERTVDLSKTAQELRGVAPTGDADWMASQADDRPAEPPVEQPRPEEARAEEARAEETPEEAPEPSKEEAAAKKTRKGRRASVPSWDEIMFGGGRSE
ncbi:MAG TPA: septation protein SepH [Nocardioidaceae bacterium]